MDDFGAYVGEGFELNAVIFSAISYKARTIAKARLRAYQGDRDSPEPARADHPLAQLVARPNPYQSWVEFQQQREVYLNVAGNSYTLLDRPKPDAPPTALYNLRPDRVWIIPEARGLKGYLYVPDGASRFDGLPVLPQDMIHVKFPNPGDPLEGLGYGLSPLAPLAQSGDVDNAVTAFLKLFIDRGAMLQGILKTKSPQTDEAVQRIKRRWREQYGGVENWGDIGVLDTDSDYQRLGLTFKEMAFDVLDARSESRMLGPLGVPPALIFTRYGLERNTFSNAEEARRALWEDTLLPELDLFAADDEYYLHGDDGVFVMYDTSAIPALQQNIAGLVDAAHKLWSMGTPANQAFAAVGLKIRAIPDGDRGYLPVNLVPVDGAPSQAVTEGDASPSATSDTRDGGADKRRTRPKAARSSAAPRWSEEAKAQLWQKADDLAVRHERAFAQAAAAQFGVDAREVLALIGDAKRRSLARKAAIQWETLLPDVQDVLAAAGERWREAFSPLIAGVVQDAAGHWRVEGGLAFDVRNLEAEEWFVDYVLHFSDPIQATSEREIAALLQQGQRDGWSVPQMQDTLTQLFEQWKSGTVDAAEFAGERLPPWRTEMIARTETIRAYNAGSTEIYRANGVEQREWLATLDDRVRDSHAEANGQIVGIDAPFEVGGVEMMYPGDPGAPPEETINCRCSTAPVME